MRPDMIRYAVARKRGAWRAVISEYRDGGCQSTYVHETNFQTRRDAAVSARELAEEIAAVYNNPAQPSAAQAAAQNSGDRPAMTVDAMTDELRRLARPIPVEPTLFALRDDARPAAARDVGTRYSEPGLFDL